MTLSITVVVPAQKAHATVDGVGTVNFPLTTLSANERSRTLVLRRVRFKYYSDSRNHAVNWDGFPDRMSVVVEGLANITHANNGESVETALAEGALGFFPQLGPFALKSEATNRALTIQCVPCAFTGWESRVTGQMFGYAGYDMELNMPLGVMRGLAPQWSVHVRMYDAEGVRLTVMPTVDFMFEW